MITDSESIEHIEYAELLHRQSVKIAALEDRNRRLYAMLHDLAVSATKYGMYKYDMPELVALTRKAGELLIEIGGKDENTGRPNKRLKE